MSAQQGGVAPWPLRSGVAAGSAAPLHPGTALCTLEDIDRLAPAVGEGAVVA